MRRRVAKFVITPLVVSLIGIWLDVLPITPGQPQVGLLGQSDNRAGATAPPRVSSLWSASSAPAGVKGHADQQPVELGVRFTPRVNGLLTAIRFFKSDENVGPHTGSLWSQDGELLARATFRDESASGWQQVTLRSPVPVVAGSMYVASYHTESGFYSADVGYFDGKGVESGDLYAFADGQRNGKNGVYRYGPSGFPTASWRSTNYWVDVVFSAGPAPEPDPAVAAPTTTSPPEGPLRLPRVPWEGGPGYYAKFPQAAAGGWTDPSFFPIGVWFESAVSQGDVASDKAAGLNTYVELTANSDADLVRANGMFAIPSLALTGHGSESVGWMLDDEVDMRFGPGRGYEVMAEHVARTPDDGRFRYSNYGKGVMLWETDAEAQRFVNSYTDVVSNDIYYYTDPNICSELQNFHGVPADRCRRAANYGFTMDRMRALDGMDGKRQPIWAFVENGHPFSEDWAPTITGPQLTGAVVSSLIHEARGIIYFNHNFGGPCPTQHVLRESCGAAIRPYVTEVNRQITALAPVLNTQSYQYSFNPALDTMLKHHDGAYYVFAMQNRDHTSGSYAFTLPAGMRGTSVEVMFENRTLPVSGGTFNDSFAAEHSYHIYKIS
jgi:hypothetical protein